MEFTRDNGDVTIFESIRHVKEFRFYLGSLNKLAYVIHFKWPPKELPNNVADEAAHFTLSRLLAQTE